MNKNHLEGAALATEIRAMATSAPGCEIALCPPFTALRTVGQLLDGGPIHLGAQNLHSEPRGAFTGEVSGAMLAALGCRFVIVGHSERRHGMGETDDGVAAKLRATRREGMTPIVCVGETLAQREAEDTERVLERQIRAAYEELAPQEARTTVVAYEPVWAIGTGRVATSEQARDAHRAIRETLDRALGPGAGGAVAILYGGSVSPQNAGSLFAVEDVDGALVGG